MPSQPVPKSCATCARADCQLVTSPADCGRWINTDDPITAEDIAANHPLLTQQQRDEQDVVLLKCIIARRMQHYPHGQPHPETVDMIAAGLLAAIDVSNSRPAEYAGEPWIQQPAVKHATHCLRHVTRARISLFSATLDWPEMNDAFDPSQRPTWIADDGTPELAHAVLRGMMGLWQHKKENQ